MYYNTIFDGSRKDAFNVNKVYLIKDTKTGYIKIGFTSVDVNQRLKSLQTGNPSKLKLLKVYDGNMQDEQNLHKLFTNKKVGGEWFNLNFFDSMKISKYFKNLYKFDD